MRVGPVKEKGEHRETGTERWARWRRLLDKGVYKSRAELARAEGVTRAAVTQGLRSTDLGACYSNDWFKRAKRSALHGP